MRKWFSLFLAALAGLASAESDDWLCPGKLGHLVVPGSITTVGTGVAHGMLRADRGRAALYGASAALVAGGVKELYDWQFGQTRRFDLRDIALNIAGAGLGVASNEAAAGWLRPRHETSGGIMAATGTTILASTLLAGVSAFAWEEQDQRRDWCLPVGLVGVGGLALCVASHFVERANSR